MRISDWSSDVCSSDLIAFREVADPVDRTYPSANLANDDGGYYFRALGHRLDGEAETGAPGRARQLAGHFRPVWDRARPCTESRALGLSERLMGAPCFPGIRRHLLERALMPGDAPAIDRPSVESG